MYFWLRHTQEKVASAPCDDLYMRGFLSHVQELGANFNVGEIPEQYKAEAEEWHEKLIEKAVEVDDAAMEAYFEGEVSRRTGVWCIHTGADGSPRRCILLCLSLMNARRGGSGGC